MKPKEFDELVRKKFDQNDFEYNPQNWDKLAEAMDGRTKKRNFMMWWWVPLTGIAASVALAIGVTATYRLGDKSTGTGAVAATSMPATHTIQPTQAADGASNLAATGPDATANAQYAAAPHNTHHQLATTGNRHSRRHQARQPHISNEGFTGVTYANVLGNGTAAPQSSTRFNFMAQPVAKTQAKAKKKEELVITETVETFKPQPEVVVPKVPRLSIILSGGISHGTANNGYMAGATVRRMLNSRLYIESDVALASSNNTQSQQYISGYDKVLSNPAAKTSAARTTNPEAGKVTPPPTYVYVPTYGAKDVSYDLYYAQVTPSIGYKIIRKMSVGVGPDFQQMIVDNRPAQSTVERGTIQSAPVFDIGFVGKTEYSITRNVKAAVAYRKGINNIITPMDKYIERDYLQFQVKCAIFNK